MRSQKNQYLQVDNISREDDLLEQTNLDNKAHDERERILNQHYLADSSILPTESYEKKKLN